MEQTKINPATDIIYCDGITRPDGKICLPPELKDFKSEYVQLKIMNMEDVLDNFSVNGKLYRRAYNILDELDREVMAGYNADSFNVRTEICYKENGYALFRFHHFELDARDPDPRYHSLYIVYMFVSTLI